MDSACLGSTYHFRTGTWTSIPFPAHQELIEVVIVPSVGCLYMGVFTPKLIVYTLPPLDWDMVIDTRELTSIALNCFEMCKVDFEVDGVAMSPASLDTIMLKNNMHREMLFEKQNVDTSRMADSMVPVFHSQVFEIGCTRTQSVSFVFYIMTNCTEQPLLVQVNKENADHWFPFEGYQPAKVAVIEDIPDPTTYIMDCLLTVRHDNSELGGQEGRAAHPNNTTREGLHSRRPEFHPRPHIDFPFDTRAASAYVLN